MSARESLSNLTLPTDIGNEERILSHRQKIIEERLIKYYAEELLQLLTNWLSKISTAVSLIIHHKDSILVL